MIAQTAVRVVSVVARVSVVHVAVYVSCTAVRSPAGVPLSHTPRAGRSVNVYPSISRSGNARVGNADTRTR